MILLDKNKINSFILEKHHLTDRTKTDNIIKIVGDIWGLHATSPKSPYLSLFERTKNFNRADLDIELDKNKTLCKFRSIRKTVHIIKKEEVPIAYSATKGFVELASGNFMKYLGITKEEYNFLSKSIIQILAHQGMAVKEIKEKLKTNLNISPVVNLMCDQALLVRGLSKQGWKSNNHTYYILNQYFPDIDLDSIEENKAKKLLVKHYIASYGPVTEADISWWTGFIKRDVIKILKEISKYIIEVKIKGLGKTYIIAEKDVKKLQEIDIDKDTINLLPSLDPYIMGYKERDRYINNEHYNFTFDRSGNATSTIILNGKVIGVWDIEEVKELIVKFFIFEKIGDSILDKIYKKAEKIGYFISDKKTAIRECKSMIALDKRTAGSVMSPLKDA